VLLGKMPENLTAEFGNEVLGIIPAKASFELY
jgi:hypothetical protein